MRRLLVCVLLITFSTTPVANDARKPRWDQLTEQQRQWGEAAFSEWWEKMVRQSLGKDRGNATDQEWIQTIQKHQRSIARMISDAERKRDALRALWVKEQERGNKASSAYLEAMEYRTIQNEEWLQTLRSIGEAQKRELVRTRNAARTRR